VQSSSARASAAAAAHAAAAKEQANAEAASTNAMQIFSDLMGVLVESHYRKYGNNTARVDAEVLKDLRLVATHWCTHLGLGLGGVR